ncbi:hypothetical protein AXG93_4080s1120 [Marchantia polymorpha subsp. ruderalis]|uniref:glucose-1-phosphate adenylyltransferase n=1 Tax=Marchantia polymorpha subsp. ruderalis TaxID=1480154 RepID=A0A176VWH1_MARPO|nr:hypothetical protein AXG93_4080s1120 [Marchantia polymorpha subsp. ruderalis]
MAAAAVTSVGWHCAVKNVAVASTSGVAERSAEASFGRSAFRGDAVSGFLKQGNRVLDSSRSGSSRQQSVFKRAPISSVITEVAKKTVQPVDESPRADPKTVVSLILGGGAGTRLFPLTKRRAKPAVPIGGGYRLIDVPMSNCINSGINKVFILTQFNSASLNRHLARTYNFGNGINFGDGFVEGCNWPIIVDLDSDSVRRRKVAHRSIACCTGMCRQSDDFYLMSHRLLPKAEKTVLAATQTPGEGGKEWFQGTADAVRQYLWLFEDAKNKNLEDVLILSGDHLYRMDYMDFVEKHRNSGADITISCVPMDDSRASDYGLMKIDDTGRVLYFSEKPKGADLKAMEVDTSVLGLSAEDAKSKPYIASMGIYVFKKEILQKLLRWRYPTANDFGSEIIPASAKEFNVQAYLFDDYWEDIGTIKSFFDANLGLTAQPPKFSFYDAVKPIFTSPRYLPPSKIEKCRVEDSIISHGCFLRDCSIKHSIVGIRSQMASGSALKDTMMLGADYYETDAERAALIAEGKVPIGVGANCKISNCIIDKNARIGSNVVIANADNVQEAERASQGYYIRSGIVVILKNSTIAPGTVI